MQIRTIPEYAQQPNYRPWVGRSYGRDSIFGIRLLILGESHYVNPQVEDNIDFTNTVIENHITGKQQFSYFTKIAKVLNEDQHEVIELEVQEMMYSNVMFYNFVQELMAGTRKRPTSRQWDLARHPFKTVVDEYKPDAILMTGKRLADHVNYRPREVNFAHITHPSAVRHFKYSEAIETLQNLCRQSQNQKNVARFTGFHW